MIELIDICRDYIMGDSTVKALDQVNLKIEKGEFIAIMGASGSGKSTLMNILGSLNLGDRAKHMPSELSGGQRQRVAIARALANDPDIILADEPTGNLDSKSSLEIMEIMKALNSEGRTVIIVTHEHDIADYANRTITFRDGRVISDVLRDDTLKGDA